VSASEIFGLPQPLNGNETVTIRQVQNGQIAQCTMPLSQLSVLFGTTAWANSLPTTKPAVAGMLWNNSGVVCIS
jgi:hypothetical protein